MLTETKSAAAQKIHIANTPIVHPNSETHVMCPAPQSIPSSRLEHPLPTLQGSKRVMACCGLVLSKLFLARPAGSAIETEAHRRYPDREDESRVSGKNILALNEVMVARKEKIETQLSPIAV